MLSNVRNQNVRTILVYTISFALINYQGSLMKETKLVVCGVSVDDFIKDFVWIAQNPLNAESWIK